MAKKVNFRIAVGDADGPRSSIWRGFSNGNDVYLTAAGMAGVEKFSFHGSGICRQAFTKEEGPADGERDRVLHRWRRMVPVPAGGLVQVLTARFPSDYLSTSLRPERKSVEWLPRAASGSATLIDFAFSGAGEETTRIMAKSTGRTIVSFTNLPNGEAFVVTWMHHPWNGESFTMPGLFDKPDQYVVSKSDPSGSGRPAGFTLFIDPTEEHLCWWMSMVRIRLRWTQNSQSRWEPSLGRRFSSAVRERTLTRRPQSPSRMSEPDRPGQFH
jgi:hypothetical protein